MTYNLYSIYDRLSHTYGSPFLQVNDACAIRYFQGLVKNTKDMPAGDYDLCLLGVFNSSSGHLFADDNLPVIANGGEFVQGEEVK